MYIQELGLTGQEKVLHIAPEKGIHDQLKPFLGGNYLVADFAPERYPFAESCTRIDLCDMAGWESEQFDLILHSHVIEHVPCTLAYPLFHLHRMLKKDGLHLCIIPFLPGTYDEAFGDLSKQERRERFGQWDHVRRLGSDDIDRHLGKIVRLPSSFDAARKFGARRLRKHNIPKSIWRGFHTSTVLELSRSDLRFPV